MTGYVAERKAEQVRLAFSQNSFGISIVEHSPHVSVSKGASTNEASPAAADAKPKADNLGSAHDQIKVTPEYRSDAPFHKHSIVLEASFRTDGLDGLGMYTQMPADLHHLCLCRVLRCLSECWKSVRQNGTLSSASCIGIKSTSYRRLYSSPPPALSVAPSRITLIIHV